MSTRVDKKPKRKRRLSASQTRELVLLAARRAFSRAGYDVVGIREIAKAAPTDPAVVIRLFGSKAALFEAVASSIFESEPLFGGSVETMPQRIAQHLMSPIGATDGQKDAEFDDFQFLLRSATSPVAAPILSAALHSRLIVPLAVRIGEHDALLSATLLISQVLGFSTLRFALGSQVIESARRAKVIESLTAAMRACIAEKA
jgi:AcrR family transcriptional regulator